MSEIGVASAGILSGISATQALLSFKKGNVTRARSLGITAASLLVFGILEYAFDRMKERKNEDKAAPNSSLSNKLCFVS